MITEEEHMSSLSGGLRRGRYVEMAGAQKESKGLNRHLAIYVGVDS